MTMTIVLLALAVTAGCAVCSAIAHAQLRASLERHAQHLRHAHEEHSAIVPMMMYER